LVGLYKEDGIPAWTALNFIVKRRAITKFMQDQREELLSSQKGGSQCTDEKRPGCSKAHKPGGAVYPRLEKGKKRAKLQELLVPAGKGKV